MFSCRKASRLMSDELDRELTRRERFSLRAHLFICRYCRWAIKHLRFLQELGQRWLARRDAAAADRKLSAEARERIRQRLDDLD